MQLLQWLQECALSIRQLLERRAIPQRDRRRSGLPDFQVLEDRCLLSAITVTSLEDNLDVDGQVTLREAIHAANTDTSVDGSAKGDGPDTILFAEGLTGTIRMSLGVYQLTSDIAVVGPGSHVLTIDAQQQSEIFVIDEGTPYVIKEAEISGLTLTQATRSTVFRGTSGAIRNFEILVVSDCVVTGNSVSGLSNVGGGIVVIKHSVFSQNAAPAYGGGIFNSGQCIAEIYNSTIAGNSADSGGGIFSTGRLRISHTTIAGNTAVRGAGVSIDVVPPKSVVRDDLHTWIDQTTIANNVGIYGSAISYQGALSISSSTIAGNQSGSDSAAIDVVDSPRRMFTLGLTHTILAGNRGSDSEPLDLASATVSTLSGHNIVGQVANSAGGIIDGVNGNSIGIDWQTVLENDGTAPLLKNNGGPTQTVALLPGSPATDAGVATADEGADSPTDQRGIPRPQGNGFDIGAFESRNLDADYGDAPDAGPGTGTGNYHTTATDNGPSHGQWDGRTLHLGASVDGDSGTLQNATALADDVDSTLPDDEDGVLNPWGLQGTVGSQPQITLFATNNTGTDATLYGWIDYNQDGVFSNAGERASIAVPAGVVGERFTLTFPVIPDGATGVTYARFRLSTDDAAADSTGPATDGEVEDYRFEINFPGTGIVDHIVHIAPGQPNVPPTSKLKLLNGVFTSLGDLDGDGVPDLAMATRFYTGGADVSGAVLVFFMNADGSIKRSETISGDNIGDVQLDERGYFGRTVATIGDLDGDGVVDLAVQADGSDPSGPFGNTLPDETVILFLNRDGSVKRSTTVAVPIPGEQFNHPRQLAGIGDIDGDGIPDLAVGIGGEDSGRGLIHVLMMNSDGTVRGSTTIGHNHNGGPDLSGVLRFGRSLAGVGDINGDGVSDIAVGTLEDGQDSSGRGSIYILLMKPDGTAGSHVHIASETNGGPVLEDFDYFAGSLTAVGDMDGNGTVDLAVGAFGHSTDHAGRGAVFLLFLDSYATVVRHTLIAQGVGGGPEVPGGSFFGSQVAGIGDINGDGVVDLAVGNRKDTHILMIQPEAPTEYQPRISPLGLYRDNQFTLNWDHIPGAYSYEVWYTHAQTETAPYIHETVHTNSFTPAEPLAVGTYHIWVRVRQNDGSTSQWSEPVTVGVRAPVQLHPVSFQQPDLTPSFSWDPLPKAVRYEIAFDNDTDGESRVYSNRQITETTFTPPLGSLSFGLHRVWVQGINEDGFPMGWSRAGAFSLGPQPTSPVGPTFSRRPSFEWTSVPGAETYEVFIRTASGDIVQVGINGTSWTPATNLPDGQVYWWVRGYSENDRSGPWSDRQELNAEGRAVVQEPLLVASNTAPTVSWSLVGLASRYDVHIERSDTAEVVFRRNGITSTSITADVLTDGEYQVWVRAHKAGTPGPWSRPVSIVVEGRTHVTAPTGTSIDTTPTFSWAEVQGVSRYILHIEDEAGNVVLREDHVATTHYTMSRSLEGGNYRVWVKAISAVDDSSGVWSRAQDFTIVNITQLVSPAAIEMPGVTDQSTAAVASVEPRQPEVPRRGEVKSAATAKSNRSGSDGRAGRYASMQSGSQGQEDSQSRPVSTVSVSTQSHISHDAGHQAVDRVMTSELQLLDRV